MKTSLNTIKSISLCAVFMPATALFSYINAAEVAKVTVNGMVCAFCAQGIEKTISRLPQTKAVYVNLDKKIVAVEAKEGQTLDMSKIKAGIVDAGYDVVKTETLANSSVAAVKSEITGKK